MARTTDPGEVRVFRNLTRRCLSIQARVPGKGWRTVAHASRVALSDARFVVSEAGRQRTLRTGRKVVHAWVHGTLRGWSGSERGARVLCDGGAALDVKDAEGCSDLPLAVTYNPRRDPGFVLRAIPPAVVATAERALLTPEGCAVLEPTFQGTGGQLALAAAQAL